MGCEQFVVTSSGGVMTYHPQVMGMYHVNDDLFKNGKVTYQKENSDGSKMYVFLFPYEIYDVDDWKWKRPWTVRVGHLSIVLF